MTTRDKRRAKMKKTLRGTKQIPRVVVFRSNRYLYAQMVDDEKGKTLASADKLTNPADLGKLLAEKGSKLGIQNIVFDRAGYKYHGKVKQIAEKLREGGLKF